MHEYKHRMLKCIGQEPRTLLFFTAGPVHSTISATLLERYLAEMQAEGLTFERDDRHHITQAGLELLAKPTTKAEPRVYGAYSTQEPYKPPQWNVRAGGEQHKQFSSRGV